MFCSSNILLNLLCCYRGKPYIKTDSSKNYKNVLLLPQDFSELSPDNLYVCKLSEALSLLNNNFGCHFACISDCYLTEEEREDSNFLHDIILIDENRPVSWLFNLIQTRFNEINNWENELRDIIIRDGNYQDLIDASENIIKNSLFLTDGAYRLIACSKHYRSTTPMHISLYEKGYHTDEYLKTFSNLNRFNDEAYKRQSATLYPANETSPFETITAWCMSEDIPMLQFTEVLTHNPLLADSKELFEILMRYVRIIFKRENPKEGTKRYNVFLRDIINNKLNDYEIICSSAQKCGIPLSGCFDAYRIIFREKSRILPMRFVEELEALLPGSFVTLHDFEISVLNTYSTSNIEEATEKNITRLLPLLKQNDAYCGVSSPFETFINFRNACQQAENALKCGMIAGNDLLSANSDLETYSNIFYYKNYFIYCVLEQASSGKFNPLLTSSYIKKLDRLKASEKENGGELANVLFWFLFFERNATEAGRHLHMHRNTVMYHVQRAVDILDINLDSYTDRLGLLISYHLRKLKPAANPISVSASL